MPIIILFITKSITNDAQDEPQYKTAKSKLIQMKKIEIKWLTGVGPMTVSHRDVNFGAIL